MNAAGEPASPDRWAAKPLGPIGDESIEIDGSRFHLLWLRDNCDCAACRDPATGQKLFDITATAMSPRLVAARQDAVALTLVWDEAGRHHSRYSRDWLHRNTYDPPAPSVEKAYRLWHRVPDGLPVRRTRDDPCWRDDLFGHGFALLQGLDAKGYAALLDDAGPVTHTEFGRVAPLQAQPDAVDLGETGAPLAPHADFSLYMAFPPVASFLHCLHNDSDGGITILVDGFAAAERLRETAPDAFDLLVRTRLPFHQVYPRWRFHHFRERPVIELDAAGRVSGVFAGHEHTRDWQLAFDAMMPVYVAYAALRRLLNDPARQLRHRLRPGECLIYQNERVLHGRSGFDTLSGARHLQVAYVNWSYLEARRRFSGVDA